ncbi:MAG: RNA polymerase sigma factor [Candidatus Fermentibacter sp.]|nr:RNA polymerase sigma factor [Candidatus Fermentibacter sp.]
MRDADGVADVVDRAKAGDRQAFDSLVRDFAGFVHALARRTVGDPDEACDIAQEVFVKAWLNLGLLRESGRFPSWLASITRRAAIDHLRKRIPGQVLEGEDIEGYGAEDRRPDPGSGLLETALSRLPERDRSLLTLVYFHEMTHAEAGDVLGIPGKNVRVYLLRARRRLREILEGRENELVQQIC